MESQNSLEVSAKTVEEATKLALTKLGLKPEEVEITVLKKGKTGILGLGAEEARILVRPLASPTKKEVSQVAQEVLQAMLAAMGISATVNLSQPPPQGLAPEAEVVALDIQGRDLGALIGRRGQSLAAIQYVLNLIVSHRLKSHIPIIVDVEGYKKRRYETLHSLAQRLAEQVKATGQAATLEPMSANERRIVHLSLASHPDVITQSIGVGELRKVVIMAKGKDSRARPSRPEAKGGEDHGVL